MDRYKRNAGCVFNVKYHLVWCPKYRKPVLINDIAIRLREVLSLKAKQLGIEVEMMEIQPDHVHVFITGQPTEAIQHIVNQLKGYSSHVLRSEFATLRSRLPTLWSRSYYIGTVGYVSEAAVRKYIENQKGK
ncbi:MAG: IS200/IS605 family transposase [Chloroflexi bacterium]|nr:IS200/IS605 family transposase [Chloroflexota bacterium]